MIPNAEVAAQLEALCRGTVKVETREELARKLENSLRTGRPLRIKLGVDPTRSDLHLGHAVPLRKLRQFQQHGHQVVLIIGDYTACVGDPSGRNQTRPPLTHAEVTEHARSYVEQAAHILDMSRVEVVYNGSWFSKLGFLDVIRLAARSTVARLLERDDFSKRYKSEQPIALHELLYPLMQAYDSVQVRADVELGGSDQLFNLLMGRDLMRQEALEAQVCMTFPLLVGTDGVQKMSKSYGNYVGLTDPSEAMFGKVMSIPDALLSDWFLLCTDLDDECVARELARGPRDAKASLAREIVALYHGEPAARAAEEAFNRVFRDRQQPEEIADLPLAAADLTEGKMWIVQLIVKAGLAAANNEARRKIEGGGVQYDGNRISDAKAQVAIVDGAVLRVGKLHYRRTRLIG